ncbi:MAG: cupin domain-containing protein, partial [Dehalococcoidia bacterium]
RAVPLEPWERKGGLGVFINLEGAGESDDAYLCEIPPAGSLKPQKHMFEETIFILKGRGATTIWTDGGSKRTFEWQEGSLFSPPLNVWHQHFNGQEDQPARYLAVTTAPVIVNLFRSLDFVFNNDFVFHDRYDAREDYFGPRGKSYASRVGMVWESNFIPDTRSFKLHDYGIRGAGGKNVKFALSDNTLGVHISEFPVGTYKKAHRHGPGAHVVILSGKGYTLMWPAEGQPKRKFDWHEGSMLVPPDFWFHQHFNTGKEPAKYLAVTWGSAKFGVSWRLSMSKHVRSYESVKVGGNQIDYEDEDPDVRQIFEEELAKEGVEVKMPLAKG